MSRMGGGRGGGFVILIIVWLFFSKRLTFVIRNFSRGGGCEESSYSGARFEESLFTSFCLLSLVS
jgi:hypothetical protein